MKTNKLGLMMAAMVVAGWMQVGFGQNLNEGLVAYYPFNGNANDESGNGNHGSVSGAKLTADRNDEKSNAYKFDGSNDFISLKNPSAFKLQKHTISCWIRCDSFGNTIYSSEPHLKSDGFGLGTGPNGFIGYKIMRGSTQADWGGIYHQTDTRNNVIEFGKWHQITVSYDGNVKKIYRDGELVKTETAGISITFGNIPVIIGAQGAKNGGFFRGDLDDLRFYNRALSEVEVAALYELEKPKPTEPQPVDPDLNKGLVAYYPFNGNANDESGNGNHGSVSGPSLTVDRNDKNSSAYEFDGSNDFISLKNPNAFKLQKHTISCWVRCMSFGNIIYSSEPSLRSDGFGLGTGSNGMLSYKIMRGSTQADWGGIYHNTKTGNHVIEIGKWHQIIVSYDGNVKKIYRDGELVKTETAGISITFGNIPVIIGATGAKTDGFFRGDLDDLRFYNRAFSSAEVTALYQLEKPKPPIISTHPKSSTHPEGSNFNITVGINGIYTDVFIQWFKDGQFLSGQNSAELAINNASLEDSGEYYALISAGGKTLITDVVEITIVEIDTDNDGLLDHVEIEIGTDITKADTDDDGLSDYEEYITYKTSPISADSDGDGLPDGVEIAEGFDPLVGTEASDGELSIRTAVELEFFTLKSQSYQLQWSTDLSNWNNDGSPFKGVGGFSSILRFAREDGEYWRLKVVE